MKTADFSLCATLGLIDQPIANKIRSQILDAARAQLIPLGVLLIRTGVF